MHEGAHYNLHPNRKINDLLTNLFASGIVGVDVERYRPIHFDHHRYLGSPADTEISYFDPLDIRYIVETLTGIKVLRVIGRRSRSLNDKAVPRSVQAYVVLVCGVSRLEGPNQRQMLLLSQS